MSLEGIVNHLSIHFNLNLLLKGTNRFFALNISAL